MSDGIEWGGDGLPAEVATAGMDNAVANLNNVVLQLAQFFAPQIETWMKQEALWVDRTGNLRQSLYADVQELVNGCLIVFDYGLDYGKYLEFGNAGHYAIIGPALDYWGVQVMNAVRALGTNGVSVSTVESTGL